MKPLSREERLFVLELVTDIASEAAQSPNVVWMIEFQEELVEKLYRKMVALVEEPPAAAGVADAGDLASPTSPLAAFLARESGVR